MNNRFTRAVDKVAHYAGWVIDLPPKGAYAAALFFLLLAYAIHSMQLHEYIDQLQTTKYEQKEQRKLDDKKADEQTEQQAGRNGC